MPNVDIKLVSSGLFVTTKSVFTMHDARVSEERLRKLQLTTSSSTLSLEQKIQALLAQGLDTFGLENASVSYKVSA